MSNSCVRVFRVSLVCPGSPRCLFTGSKTRGEPGQRGQSLWGEKTVREGEFHDLARQSAMLPLAGTAAAVELRAADDAQPAAVRGRGAVACVRSGSGAWASASASRRCERRRAAAQCGLWRVRPIADTQLLHHRAHRPRQVDARRPAAADDQNGRGPRDAGAAA